MILAGAIGCGSNESPPAPKTTASSTKAAITTTPTQTKPESDATPPEHQINSEPVSVTQPVSPEQQKAQAAFQTMTAEGVSPEDLDAATETLLALGAPAMPVLAKGLQSPETLEREMAATILAQFGAAASDAKDELIAVLKDDSVFVRANAATALAQMDGQAQHVVPVFSQFLEGDDEHLRRMAAMNLAVLDVSAVKPLVGKLSDALQNDDREVRLAIVELLGRIGPDAGAAVAAIKAIDTTDDPELQTAVTAALMQIEPDTE